MTDEKKRSSRRRYGGLPLDQTSAGLPGVRRERHRSAHLLVAAVGLILVCLAASAIPACRAVRIDSLRALLGTTASRE